MAPDVLVRHRRDPLFGLTRQEVLGHLRSTLAGRVQAAYVYGSFARDDMQPGSDIDMIVVTETDLPFPARGRSFEDLRDRLPSLEILVYTPTEFAEMTTDPSPGF